jgi:hypothetical protein
MVEHQMIYSPERKKQLSLMKYILLVTSLEYLVNNGNNLLTLLAADPPSSCPEWAPLCPFSCFHHPCWVLTDSFPQSRTDLARIPYFLQNGSRELWIQATACFSVGHK